LTRLAWTSLKYFECAVGKIPGFNLMDMELSVHALVTSVVSHGGSSVRDQPLPGEIDTFLLLHAAAHRSSRVVRLQNVLIDVNENPRRPFYAEYAWAFDLIIDRPVRKECAAIATWLIERDVLPGAALLDAGCGTGKYSIELARRGYLVHGIDASPELVDVARRSIGDRPGSVSFVVGDILTMPAGRYDAILCRGVLNDIINEADRQAVFDRFVEVLQPNGVLILDVREWHASAERKAREPVFRKRVSTDRGELTFTSVTALDPEHRRLVISEQHALVDDDGQERVADYQFVMRCWTSHELRSTLARRGFGRVAYFGAYDARVEAGATDRLVAVAQRKQPAPLRPTGGAAERG
jgi:SAM-dependent methyltransferase